MSDKNAAVKQSIAYAEEFIKAFYKAYDGNPTDRATSLAPLYTSKSRITWNGNALPVDSLAEFFQRLPKSRHDVQAFDCHPIQDSFSTPTPVVTLSISGQVAYGSYIPKTPLGLSPSDPDFDLLPRVFSQSFVLSVGDGKGPGPKYSILADTFRFA